MIDVSEVRAEEGQHRALSLALAEIENVRRLDDIITELEKP